MNNMHQHIRILFVIIALLGLTGCGFKMRGSLEIPEYLKVVYLPTNDPYDPLQRELRYRLKQNHVRVIDHPQKDVTTVEVWGPDMGEEVIAFGSSGQVQRYRLSMTIRYRVLTRKGIENLNEIRSITRMRELSQSNNALLSNESEKQTVKNELLNETVTELLRQLTTRPLNKSSVIDTTPMDNSPC